ncbi:MAG: radical SAM protein [Bacteroidales bacterium]|nr:radical SAM protein [Bacteroidales bacterium]
MYEKLSEGRFAVQLNEGHLVFNQAKGIPFAVTDDLYLRMKNGDLNSDDRRLLSETYYLDEESEYEHYANRINTYINNYDGPSVLDLIISESCNLRCHRCIHAFSVEKGQPRATKRAMRFDVAKTWIDYYVDIWANQRSLKYLTFHFGAAEPFLNKKVFLKCLEYIKSKKTNLDKEILVNSNLTMIDDELLNALVDNKVKVSVGLDGLEEENDLIRIDSKGNGTFNKIIQSIRRLVAAGNVPGVNLTLTDRNYALVHPMKFLEFMKSLGINAVLVDIDFVLGISVSSEEIIDKLLDFQHLANELQIELRGNWMAPFYNLTSEDEEIEPKSFCASIRGKNIVVTPSGNLSFCTYSSNSISHTNYDDLAKAMSQFVGDMKTFMSTDYLQSNESKCAKCPLIGFCGGGCHITSEQNDAEWLMCKIYTGATYQLIRYHFDSELSE